MNSVRLLAGPKALVRPTRNHELWCDKSGQTDAVMQPRISFEETSCPKKSATIPVRNVALLRVAAAARRYWIAIG